MAKAEVHVLPRNDETAERWRHRLRDARKRIAQGERAFEDLGLEGIADASPLLYRHGLDASALYCLLMTDELDRASRMVNDQFACRDWIGFKYFQDDTRPATLLLWQVVDNERSFIRINNGLKDWKHAFFIIERLAGTMPILTEYVNHPDKTISLVPLQVGDGSPFPGIAFCSKRNDSFLVPDAVYLGLRGYQAARESYARTAVPWSERKPVGFWRGGTSGSMRQPHLGWRSLPRVELCELARFESELLDCGITHIGQMPDEESNQQIRDSGLVKPYVSADVFAAYKYNIDIDGNSNSWPGLFLKLLAGGVVMKVDSRAGYRQWYYDRLKPWVNFVPVAEDLSDLVELVEWLRQHDDTAQRIVRNGLGLAEALDFETEKKAASFVLAAAFRSFGGLPEIDLDFVRNPADRSFLSEGWHSADDHGALAMGTHSTISLPRPVAQTDTSLMLDLELVRPEGIRRLVVVANGELLLSTTLDPAESLSYCLDCPIPSTIFDQSERLEILLLHPAPRDQASRHTPLDERQLSIRLSRLVIKPSLKPRGKDFLERARASL